MCVHSSTAVYASSTRVLHLVVRLRVVFRFYTAAIHVTMVDLLLTTKFSIFSSTSTKFSSRFCIKTSKSMYKIPKYEQNT